VSDRWSTAYVAVSVALGESLEDTVASLGSSAIARDAVSLEPRCASLVATLQSSAAGSSESRARRAQALAEVLAETALGILGTALT
jgi:hypothetical protein